jgi:hypothetical protein
MECDAALLDRQLGAAHPMKWCHMPAVLNIENHIASIESAENACV